jgi:hypothetical protein
MTERGAETGVTDAMARQEPEGRAAFASLR